jgi:hypothetical protein
MHALYLGFQGQSTFKLTQNIESLQTSELWLGLTTKKSRVPGKDICGHDFLFPTLFHNHHCLLFLFLCWVSFWTQKGGGDEILAFILPLVQSSVKAAQSYAATKRSQWNSPTDTLPVSSVWCGVVWCVCVILILLKCNHKILSLALQGKWTWAGPPIPKSCLQSF